MQVPKKIFPLLLITLVLIVYANTLMNQFALDDSIVITENSFVKKGISGIPEILSSDTFTGFFGIDKKLVEGGRFRPLSMVVFAIEYQLFGKNAFIGHFTNLIAYTVLILLLYYFTIYILQLSGIKKETEIALVTVLLFAIHPVHTEVVANIKGLDEILAMLLGIGYVWNFLKLVYNRFSWLNLFGAGICLFLGLLAKENVVIYLIISVLFIPLYYRKNKTLPIVPMAIVALFFAGYIIMRWNAVGLFSGTSSSDLLNNPFLLATPSEKISTIFYILLRYLKLLLVSWPLTYDYYPFHIQYTNWGNLLVWLSVLLHAGFVVCIFLFKKEKPLLSIMIAFYLMHILLVSNLFFPIGTFMNERFLFAPSYAYVFLLSFYGVMIFSKNKYYGIALLSLLIFVQGILVMKRNTIWKDNFTLFTTDVNVSSNSAKSCCAAGSELLLYGQKQSDTTQQKQIYKKAERYLLKAVEIYPTYSDALIGLGNAYHFQDVNDIRAYQQYEKLLQYAPNHTTGLENVKKIADATDNVPMKKKAYELYLTRRPNDFSANYNLGRIYGMQLQQPDSALIYLEKAYKIDTINVKLIKDLGIAHAMAGNTDKAEVLFRKILKLEPEDPANFVNLGYLLHQTGRREEAAYYFKQAEELKK